MSVEGNIITKKDARAAVRVRFVQEYIKDFNGLQAAIRAGIPKAGAHVTASRLLKEANVQELLKAAINTRQARTDTDADKALALIEDVANADPNSLVEMRRGCCRFCHGRGGEYQFTRQEMKAAQEQHRKDQESYDRAMKSRTDSFEPFPPFDLKGGDGFNPNNKPNPDCTECFGEGEVRTFIKDTRDLTPAERRLFAGIKETNHGIEIKVNSQDKSRELLARHHGLIGTGFGGDAGFGNVPLNPAPMNVTFVAVKVDVAVNGAADKNGGTDGGTGE